MKQKNPLVLFKKYFSIEIIALVMSFFAIWTSYQQDITNREFYQLSVKPLLRIGVELSEENIMLGLENFGLGVALIDSIEIKYQGSKIKDKDFLTLLKSVDSTSTSHSSIQTTMKNHRIKADTYMNIIGISKGAEKKISFNEQAYNEKYKSIINDTDLVIHYRDLYNNETTLMLQRNKE